MIEITQDEAMALRQKYGDEVNLMITSRQKKGNRKHYFVEETNRVLYFLERLKKKQTKRGARSD